MRAVLMLMVASVLSVPPIGATEKVGAMVPVISVGNVGTSITHRVLNHIRNEYKVESRLRAAIQDVPDTVDSLRLGVEKLALSNDVCLLVLASLPAVKDELIVFEASKCVVVNVSALLPKDGEVGREETFGRRVEKESLRAIALALGYPPCPFPRCALKAHKDHAELDFKSRNPCPPCLEKVRGLLTESDLASAARDSNNVE